MVYHHSFPLVADNEPVLGERVTMELYDELDLISNIKGDYQERFGNVSVSTERVAGYEEEEQLAPPLFGEPAPTYSRKERQPMAVRGYEQQKTAGQMAREASREDIKKKKSAAYLQSEHTVPAKVYKRPATPAREIAETRAQGLARAAERLYQESYILVDVPQTYSLEKEDRMADQAVRPQKNSYDFLKKSQVYNYPERTVEKQRQVAQELNLRHIEEDLHG